MEELPILTQNYYEDNYDDELDFNNYNIYENNDKNNNQTNTYNTQENSEIVPYIQEPPLALNNNFNYSS